MPSSPGQTVPRVVIAHDFAEAYGGAERVLGEMAATFPEAEVWAIAGRRRVAERIGVADRFRTLLPGRGALLRGYRRLAPAYPALVGSRRLPDADLLLTSSYAYAHGFRTRNRAPQLCVCHGPLRFAWSMTDDYESRFAPTPIRRAAFRLLVRQARRADLRASRRVTTYVAGSEHVAGQVRRAYGRECEVLRLPVDCSLFTPGERPDGGGGRPDDGGERHFLLYGRLIEPYKRPGLVVRAFAGRDERLVVAGDGPAYAELRRAAGPNVEFTGALEDDELIPLIRRSAAVIFPSVDDFGLVPVEAMACGRPVIAFAGGGALETVVDGVTGTFFAEPTAESLAGALDRFEPGDYSTTAIREHAEQWDSGRFRSRLRELAAQTVAAPRGA